MADVYLDVDSLDSLVSLIIERYEIARSVGVYICSDGLMFDDHVPEATRPMFIAGNGKGRDRDRWRPTRAMFSLYV